MPNNQVPLMVIDDPHIVSQDVPQRKRLAESIRVNTPEGVCLQEPIDVIVRQFNFVTAFQ